MEIVNSNKSNKQKIQNRLQSLRDYMFKNNIAAVVIPTADPHLSEYLPEYWQGREWLTGFTGSAGTAVVTQDFAGLWADSRYWVQAATQLAQTGIVLQKLQRGVPTHIDWLASHLQAGDVVVIDGNVLSVAEQARLLTSLAAKDIVLKTDIDPLASIWQSRPPLPSAQVYVHDAQFVSQPAAQKLALVRQEMQQLAVSHHLLSSLDDIAWLTNLRGNDVDYNPVFLAHLLISMDTATLFIDLSKITPEVEALLEQAGITLADYRQVQDEVGKLSRDDCLLIDPDKVAVAVLDQLSVEVDIVERIAPSSMLKSRKSEQDICHIREAMRQDGAALCEFFAQFEQRLAAGERLSELDVDSMLIEARSQQPNYVSPSFPTIAGFNANGALPHYRATDEAFSYFDTDGLLLIDSGGQYQNGTTDITRVVGIGTVSAAQKRDFTLVLKAHIALASAHFPEGIASPLLDPICRAPLWQHGLDFGHGTGHGVGYFLNVHEGPQGISYSASPTPERAMREGMITSNEPGLYREGQWGIRIENLVANIKVTDSDEQGFGDYLRFETVTLCPIDTRLIDKTLLSDAEINWLNDYHQQVYINLSPKLQSDALTWLTERTQAI
ncbi:aminopeptidase P family protein [Psychrobacter sp. I-STPA10]|uniref:aminopeptidase P family protein n=1 Tax=Psychrobacter sp. I-STPA10 TaxID=2585769 RepID=UPI0022A8B2F4|nr:aminopeptidase P family protein [Psychrobacter sp. I-STPA10]